MRVYSDGRVPTRRAGATLSSSNSGRVEPSVGLETRIGGRKYLIRLGVLPAKGDGRERWKADFHQISLGRPSEVPEFGLVRGTKEALIQAVEDAAMERDPSRSG